jgi:hypothetical protein
VDGGRAIGLFSTPSSSYIKLAKAMRGLTKATSLLGEIKGQVKDVSALLLVVRHDKEVELPILREVSRYNILDTQRMS